MHKLNAIRIFLVSTTALVGSPALAQSPDDRVTILERIVVGAGNEKIAIDTPQSVTVIDQEGIDQAQPSTIADIARDIPGLNVSGSDRPLGQAFNIRGIGAPENAGDQGRIIVNIDGVDKFYQQYRTGSFFSEPELYKKVEVLRGPASSTLYGPGALGGVINLETKDASDFIQEGDRGYFRTKASFSSADEGWLRSFIFAHLLDEDTDFLLTGNYRTGEDYSTGNGTIIPGSDFDTWSGLAKLTHQTDDGGEIKLSFQQWVSDGDDQAYDRTQSAGFADFGTIDRLVVDQTALISYENDFADNDWLDLKISASYSNIQTEQRDASGIPAGVFGPFPLDCSSSVLFCDADYGYETIQFSAENTFESRGAEWENFLTIGYQYADETRTGVDLTGTYPDIGFHPQGTDESHGFYIQNEFIWNETLTLIPGIRFDSRELTYTDVAPQVTDRNSDDSAVSPKIAIHYKANDNIAFFGSFAHTERFPTIDEVFSTESNGPRFLSSPDLRKETSDNWEVGFALSAEDVMSVGDSFQLKTTYFDNSVEDLIEINPLRSPTNPGFINRDNADFQGFEIEASYDADDWYLTAAYTYTEGRDGDTGEYLTTVAPEELAITLGARLPENGIEYGWKSRFVSDPADPCRTSSTGTLACAIGSDLRFAESFNVHDVFFAWKPEKGSFAGTEFRFGIDNVFDTEYKEFLGNDPAKGRNFKFTLARSIGWP